MGERYCLKWNNFQNHLCEVLDTLLVKETLSDVTLVCEEGKLIRAHQTVLSACSPYFQEIFTNNTHPHPIVILKDISHEQVQVNNKQQINQFVCNLHIYKPRSTSYPIWSLGTRAVLYSFNSELMCNYKISNNNNWIIRIEIVLLKLCTLYDLL